MTKAELAKHPRRAVVGSYGLKGAMLRCGHVVPAKSPRVPATGSMVRCPECPPEDQA